MCVCKEGLRCEPLLSKMWATRGAHEPLGARPKSMQRARVQHKGSKKSLLPLPPPQAVQPPPVPHCQIPGDATVCHHQRHGVLRHRVRHGGTAARFGWLARRAAHGDRTDGLLAGAAGELLSDTAGEGRRCTVVGGSSRQGVAGCAPMSGQ